VQVGASGPPTSPRSSWPARWFDVIAAVTERFQIAASTIATYTPAKDRDDRTLKVDLRIIELLGEHLQ
jgi:hypothetical protein